ncbi:MAG: PAS domain S-box protein [Desulfotignum sp.]|nr:PAS domain S-box protein [Desulfotignum sp.]MCF8136114.1 PAS domain S-box protein [Desulfotignum sp.]
MEIEGKTLEEVLGKSLLDLRPNIDEYGLIPVMRNVWKTGAPAYFPVKIYTDEKFSRYYENHIFRIPTGEVVTIYNDLTDQKKTERRLIESRALLRALVDTIPDLIWLKDPDGVYLGCNPTFERFFGAKEKTIAGNTDYDFVDRDLADFFRAHDRKAMEADGPSINEEWLTFADDGYHGLFETIKTPMKTPDGRLVGVLGIARDITRRNQAEEALRNSEEKFRILFESSKEAFYFSSVQGKFIEANQSFFNLFGMEKEDLNNLWAKDIYLNLNDRSKFIDIIEKHGFVKDFKVKLMDRNGNVMDCQISATVRRSVDGSIDGYQGIIRDTTEMKQKDLEKERLIADLQKALAEVKKLSGLLPICMHCKKIRDDQGYWKQMEEYLAKHSEAQFSHSICRECAEKYYPDMDVYDK